MRVSTDPADPSYIDDRPRRAWCKDQLIEGWTIADEFRRVVVTPERVYNGAVRVERLPEIGAEPTPEPSRAAQMEPFLVRIGDVVEVKSGWPEHEEEPDGHRSKKAKHRR